MAVRISIKVKIPKELMSIPFLRDVLSDTLDQSALEVAALFVKTIEGWKKRPTFAIEHEDTPIRMSRLIGPYGRYSKIYSWVNDGTNLHEITPRNAPFLRFMSGYDAATRPRSLNSHPARRFGYWVSRLRVEQKTEARLFTEEIADQYAEVFFDNVQRAVGIASDFVTS